MLTFHLFVLYRHRHRHLHLPVAMIRLCLVLVSTVNISALHCPSSLRLLLISPRTSRHELIHRRRTDTLSSHHAVLRVPQRSWGVARTHNTCLSPWKRLPRRGRRRAQATSVPGKSLRGTHLLFPTDLLCSVCGRPTFNMKCFLEHHFDWCLFHQRPVIHGQHSCSGRDHRDCQPVRWGECRSFPTDDMKIMTDSEQRSMSTGR